MRFPTLFSDPSGGQATFLVRLLAVVVAIPLFLWLVRFVIRRTK